MISHQIQTRVRYAETDQMGFVYYGNYAQYFEMGRVEALRSFGISYKSLEDQGVMLPVVNLNVNFRSPGKYDDLLTITTQIQELPAVKIRFTYEVVNQEDTLIATGETTLVFIEAASKKPIRCPEHVIEALKSKFGDQPPFLA